jgi:hypothetical protein
LILALRRQRQTSLCEFEANLAYEVSTGQPGLCYTKKTCLENQKEKKKKKKLFSTTYIYNFGEYLYLYIYIFPQRAGEMAQQLRALAAIPKFNSQHLYKGLQSSENSSARVLMPSSGLPRHCMSVVH